MGFDLMKESTFDTGFNYLDNVFKKKTQEELLKTYDKRKTTSRSNKWYVGKYIRSYFRC